MPSTRRTFLSAMAAIPIASAAVAGRNATDYTVEWNDGTGQGDFEDSARQGETTLALNESPEHRRTVTETDKDGNTTVLQRFDNGAYWQGITATDDGGFIVTGRDSDSGLAALRVGADGGHQWQHTVPEAEYYDRARPELLADGRLAVSSHIIASHYHSNRIQFLDSSGQVDSVWDRSASYGDATAVVDGDLLVGGSTYQDGEQAWMARIDSRGETVWEESWNDFDWAYQVAVDASGGILLGGFEDRAELLVRDITADGEQRAEWRVDTDRKPLAAARGADNGVVFATNDYDYEGAPRLYRTTSDGQSDAFELASMHQDVEIYAVYPTNRGYVLTGYPRFQRVEAGRVALVTEGATEQTETPTPEPTRRTTTKTPTRNNDTEAGRQTSANATSSKTATGASGPGFGALSAGTAAIVASLARYRTAESED